MTAWLLAGFGLCGCYVDIEDPVCLGGGAERLLDFEGNTEVCCDPEAANAEGELTCADFYRETFFEGVSDLAICAPDGRCALDCVKGTNCECLLGADCGAGSSCAVVSEAERVCAHHGQVGTDKCSICTDCGQDADCAEHPLGALCVKVRGAPTHCGCTEDVHCSDGGLCGSDKTCQ